MAQTDIRKNFQSSLPFQEYALKLWLAILLSIWSISLSAKVIESIDNIPISTEASYVFFYHGAIAEGRKNDPVSERHGLYDFTGLKQSLDSKSYYLVTEHRERNANIEKHAKELANKVSDLLRNGVNPSKISIVGFSKGGGIVATAASLIDNENIRYVLLASCPQNSQDVDWPPFKGRLLSLYEREDIWAGSCAFLAEGSPRVSEFKEIVLESGLGHGEFYRPHKRWLTPVLAWISPTS